MEATPPIGLKHQKSVKVETSFTVPALPPVMGDFSGFPAVLATPHLIGFVESACIEAIKPYLTADQMTVGTHVDLHHLAATPVGMTLTADVELIAVTGRNLTFRIECRDEKHLIGTGTHERTLVDREKFLARLNS